MRNLLLILTLAGARPCTPGTDVGIKKCCPDGNESPYYNGGVGYACCGEGLAAPSEAENGVLWCCIARRTRAPDRMAQTRPFAATATPVVTSDYKQETSLVVGMTAASKI